MPQGTRKKGLNMEAAKVEFQGGDACTIHHLGNEVMQHTRTPFLTIPGSNSV